MQRFSRAVLRQRPSLRPRASRALTTLPQCEKTLEESLKRAQLSPAEFWGEQASVLKWKRPFDAVEDHNVASGRIAWFTGGRLNVAGAEGGREGEGGEERGRKGGEKKRNERKQNSSFFSSPFSSSLLSPSLQCCTAALLSAPSSTLSVCAFSEKNPRVAGPVSLLKTARERTRPAMLLPALAALCQEPQPLKDVTAAVLSRARDREREKGGRGRKDYERNRAEWDHQPCGSADCRLRLTRCSFQSPEL